MTPDRWQQIDQLLDQVLNQEPAQRQAFLQQVCAGDEALHREVEALLAAHDQANHFMEKPALDGWSQTSDQQESPSLLGRRLGPYEMLSLLGRGGMGEVYRVRDTRLDRIAALKILPPEVDTDPERLRRFVREAKAASALTHPNIATIYEIGESDGIHWIAMELVEGETLAERLNSGSLEIAVILDIGVQVAEALDEARSKAVTHRDIKPANIMLTPRGQVKVLDFGLAKRTRPQEPGEGTAARTQSQTTPGAIMGTMDYMSPEQVLGQEVDHRSDLFSLGVVLYQMATGTLPFKGDTSGAIFNAILNQLPPSPVRLNPDLPARLGEIIDKALEKDREVRYQVASEICADLKRLKRDRNSGKAAVSQAEVWTARRRVRWLLGIGTGLVLIALVAGLRLWFLHRGKETSEAPLVPIPLTSYPGEESYPSFSPDGMQVTFNWCQEGQKCHIYIKQVGVDPPFQLTNAAFDDVSPAWSPDGRTIAFIRELAPLQWALMLIPQRGGSERQLETWDVSNWGGDPPSGPYLAWTPDSKWLVFPYISANQSNLALFLISMETGEKRQLTPTDESQQTSPAFSPDGGTLAFSREYGSHTDLYLLRLGEDYKQQGELKKVDTGNSWIFGAAWTPDGQGIVFSSGNLRTPILWRADISKPGKPVRIGLPSDDAWAPSISRTGKRLAYSVERGDSNIWRVDLEGPSRKPSKPVLFISSTKPEFYPEYSPDGTRIAFVSEQSGATEVWICDSDGRNPVQLTSFGGPKVEGPKWSPDGQEIAFFASPNKNNNIYVVSASRGVPRRLSTRPGNWPFWSRDGRWLYFVVYKDDQNGIWKMPAQGGEAIQVTHKEGIDIPQESTDGKFLYYCRGWPSAQSVWKMPVDGGQETKVIDSVHPLALWTVRQEGIYYFTPPHDKNRSTLCLYEFTSGKTRKILEAERRLADVGYVAISPNGRTILYSQWDEAGSNLMLVENFR